MIECPATRAGGASATGYEPIEEVSGDPHRQGEGGEQDMVGVPAHHQVSERSGQDQSEGCERVRHSMGGG